MPGDDGPDRSGTTFLPERCPNDDCDRMLYIVVDKNGPVRNYCYKCGCSFTALKKPDKGSG